MKVKEIISSTDEQWSKAIKSAKHNCPLKIELDESEAPVLVTPGTCNTFVLTSSELFHKGSKAYALAEKLGAAINGAEATVNSDTMEYILPYRLAEMAREREVAQ